MIPVIGITANFADGQALLAKKYYSAIERAGGAPVLLAPTTDYDVLSTQLNTVDGILFTGGGDINPLLLGEQPWPQLGGINAERDRAELLTAKLCYERNIPMLGVCRGLQIIAAALGGTLMQDITEYRRRHDVSDPCLKHSQTADRAEISHSVSIFPDSILSRLYDAEEIQVNSFHHQALATPGKQLRVTAYAPDGVVEAFESAEHKPIFSVQWHPECLCDTVCEAKSGKTGLPIFEWLVEEACLFAKAKSMHRNMLTLDSHCDTPMFFHLENLNLAKGDNRVLVDFKKMQDGMLDVSNMVCYLPQPQPGDAFSKKIHFPIDSPKQYADFIFDSIIRQVEQSDGKVKIARSFSEAIQNKRNGVHSVMLGIENGLALEGDIRNVEHFAKRGITYITLCHNGDNDICDSAKGSATHGGLSAFGRAVVEEMNRLDIRIDLSHAAESTFYDVLEASKRPVVCSHSNCRALCNHPRNLTDDQMRLLAQKDGVMQITLYSGFLAEGADEASILDALKHLDHAIDIMGIDHVGLGTDFDGDGTVVGMSDASDALNFTRHLLLKRYNKEQIRKIWGGNWIAIK